MKSLLITLVICSCASAQGWLPDESPIEEFPIPEISNVFQAPSVTNSWLEDLQKHSDTMQESIDDLTRKVSNLQAEVDDIKNRPSFTEEQIRAFAKEEASKLVATVNMPDGTKKQVASKDVTPVMEHHNVVGYSGSFDVPAGGWISEIDGQPVSRTFSPAPQQAIRVVGNVLSAARTQAYTIHAARQSEGTVRFFAKPAQGTCRIVNGVKMCY